MMSYGRRLMGERMCIGSRYLWTRASPGHDGVAPSTEIPTPRNFSADAPDWQNTEVASIAGDMSDLSVL